MQSFSYLSFILFELLEKTGVGIDDVSALPHLLICLNLERFTLANFILLVFMRKAKTTEALRLIPARQCTSTFPFSISALMKSLQSEKYWAIFSWG